MRPPVTLRRPPLRSRRLRRAGLVAAAALAGPALAAPALATNGPFYPRGPVSQEPVGGFESTPVGTDFALHRSAGHVAIGAGWSVTFPCVPGARAEWVAWSAQRSAAPSSLGLNVDGDGRFLWHEPDALIPHQPATPRAYNVPLADRGVCGVRLRLTQTESRYQHTRRYYILNPHVLLRDVSAPSASVTAGPSGWIGAGQVDVSWNASDNFGSDGIGEQRVVIGDRVVWRGTPGAGAYHHVTASLAGIPDGQHPIHVDVDGDGTPGVRATYRGDLLLDRTPPYANGMAVAYSGHPGRASVVWYPRDDFSDVALSYVELNAAGDGSQTDRWVGVTGAAGPGGKGIAEVDLRPVPDGVHAWRIRTQDNAGNVGYTAAPGTVVSDTTPPLLALEPIPRRYLASLPLAFTVHDNLAPWLGVGPRQRARQLRGRRQHLGPLGRPGHPRAPGRPARAHGGARRARRRAPRRHRAGPQRRPVRLAHPRPGGGGARRPHAAARGERPV